MKKIISGIAGIAAAGVPLYAAGHMDEDVEETVVDSQFGGMNSMMGYGFGWGMGYQNWITTFLLWAVLIAAFVALVQWIARDKKK